MNNKWLLDLIDVSARKYPEEIFSTPGKIYTCVNPYKYHMVRESPEIYKKMDGIFVDGILMVKMYKLCLGKSIPRLSFDMTAIARDLFARLNKDNSSESVFFIGSKEEQIRRSIEVFKSNYPKMNIVGYRNGYFKNEEDRLNAIDQIIKQSPTFTVVGLGGNIQEQFAYDLKQAGYKGIVFTCGGFLHQSSEKLNYYPKWVDKYNLRGPYRIIKERNYSRIGYLLAFFGQFIWDKMSSAGK